MVTFPIDIFLVESDLTIFEKRVSEFKDGLTEWKPETNKIGIRDTPMISISGKTHQEINNECNNYFLKNLWGDGMPIIPPDTSRVDWILKGSDLPRHETLGKLLPRGEL